jgi:hypothetical protein
VTAPLGSSIAKVVTEIAEAGFGVATEEHSGSARTYWLFGAGFKIEVFTPPGQLFFMEIGVRDGSRWRFAYRLDTDLYPLAPPGSKFYDIGAQTESNIRIFLASLVDGHARIGRAENKIVLVFPTSNGFIQVTVGRRAARSEELTTQPTTADGLIPLRDWQG